MSSDLKSSYLAGLEQDCILHLFEVHHKGEVFRFHNYVNEMGNAIVWRGASYNVFPIEVDGFSRSGRGTQPVISITVGNANGVLSNLLPVYGDFVGAEFRRLRGPKYCLDAVNFAQGNEDADPAGGFPHEVFEIAQKVSENAISVEWSAEGPLSLERVKLPGRIASRTYCTAVYGSKNCGLGALLFEHVSSESYGAGARVRAAEVTVNSGLVQIYVAKINVPEGIELNDESYWQKDFCDKTLRACEDRFGEGNVLRFNGFPGSNLPLSG